MHARDSTRRQAGPRSRRRAGGRIDAGGDGRFHARVEGRVDAGVEGRIGLRLDTWVGGRVDGRVDVRGGLRLDARAGGAAVRVGLDIGGTKIDAVVVDASGAPVHRLRLPTGFGPETVLTNAAAAVTSLADRVGVAVGAFESVGVGIPGLVDGVTGRVRHAVNIGFDDVAVGPTLGARLGVPVQVENDVNAAALGAYLAMSLSGSVGYLNLGTGLAAGLVVDGELWRGSRGVSGEIGHVPVDPGGELCPCGQRGCLETVAAGAAVSRHWPTDGAYPAVALFAAADAGDPEAGRVRADLAAGVAAAVRLLVLTTDVDSVVIGGGLSNLGRPLLDDIAGVLDRWAAGSPFLASLELSSRIELLPPGFPVAAVGAATVGARGSGAAVAAAL